MGGMVPLSDASRRPERIPIVTALIIVINVCVFVLELMRGDAFVMVPRTSPQRQRNSIGPPMRQAPLLETATCDKALAQISRGAAAIQAVHGHRIARIFLLIHVATALRRHGWFPCPDRGDFPLFPWRVRHVLQRFG